MITVENFREKFAEEALRLLQAEKDVNRMVHSEVKAWEQKAQLLAVQYRLYEILERKEPE